MNQTVYSRRPPSAIPDVILVLLISNGLLFAAEQFAYPVMQHYLAAWPISDPRFWPWQLVTYGFLHDPRGLTHIGFNMFALWMFGRELEWMMGPKRFLVYYMTCVVGAALVHLFVGALQGWSVPMVGASGGVFGLLLAYGMAFPNRTVMLLFPPIPMKAKYFVILYGLLEFYLGVSGRNPGVANFAHLGGMLFGFLLIRYWASQRRR
jgi:membrane associated rhomboid family serine protease